jgi:hypothetical protein
MWYIITNNNHIKYYTFREARLTLPENAQATLLVSDDVKEHRILVLASCEKKKSEDNGMGKFISWNCYKNDKPESIYIYICFKFLRYS